jgi:hypothetical protein
MDTGAKICNKPLPEVFVLKRSQRHHFRQNICYRFLSRRKTSKYRLVSDGEVVMRGKLSCMVYGFGTTSVLVIETPSLKFTVQTSKYNLSNEEL